MAAEAAAAPAAPAKASRRAVARPAADVPTGAARKGQSPTATRYSPHVLPAKPGPPYSSCVTMNRAVASPSAREMSVYIPSKAAKSALFSRCPASVSENAI